MQEISPLFILMEIEIITPKISNNREDSFWYWGKEIAKIKLENNHTLLMDVSGDVKYLEKGNKYKNKEAIDLLMSDEYCLLELLMSDIYCLLELLVSD